MKILLTLAAMTFAAASYSASVFADEECYPDPWEPAYTCFAHDASGHAQGVSSSFTSQAKAAARALASCQRKSQNPRTCHITSCQSPQVHCHDHNGHGGN
jgi:hypothetical protein